MSNVGVYHLTDWGCSYVCEQKYDLDYNCGAGLVSTMINNSCCICVREQNKYFLHIDLCCWAMLQQNMPLEGVRPLPLHWPSYLFLPIIFSLLLSLVHPTFLFFSSTHSLLLPQFHSLNSLFPFYFLYSFTSNTHSLYSPGSPPDPLTLFSSSHVPTLSSSPVPTLLCCLVVAL